MPDKLNPKIGDVFWDASMWFLVGQVDTLTNRVTISQVWPNQPLDKCGGVGVRFIKDGATRDNMGSTGRFYTTEKEAITEQLKALREMQAKNLKDAEKERLTYIVNVKHAEDLLKDLS